MTCKPRGAAWRPEDKRKATQLAETYSYAGCLRCCAALRRGRWGALKRSEATAKACAGGRPADAGGQAESALLGVDTGGMVASERCQRVASGVATCCK
jgi:hypothetical protein